MKKLIMYLLSLLIAGSFITSQAFAGGPNPVITQISASPTSALNNGAAITVTVFTYYYKCSLKDSGSDVYTLDSNYCAANGLGTSSVFPAGATGTITATGSGNTLSTTSLTTDSSGHGSFTIASTVAEAKTVTFTAQISQPASTTVYFIVPATSSSDLNSTSKKSAATPAPSSTPAPVAAPAPPAQPTLARVTIDGATADTTKTVSIAASKSLVLSGTTVANGVIVLTIHSTPRTATVTADKDGKWSYTVSGLEPGDHYIEAAVTDPNTQKASETTKLLSFVVTAAKQTAPVATAKSASSKGVSVGVVIIIALVVLILATGGIGWYVWRRKHHRQQAAAQQPSGEVADAGDKRIPPFSQ